MLSLDQQRLHSMKTRGPSRQVVSVIENIDRFPDDLGVPDDLKLFSDDFFRIFDDLEHFYFSPRTISKLV
jgi:hypothetical protein